MKNTRIVFFNVAASSAARRFAVAAMLAVVCLMLVSADALAEWRVSVESKGVALNETGVTLGISASWDYALGGFTVPLVVRELSTGSFWTGALPYDTNGISYYHPSFLGVTWHWATLWANLVEEVRPGIPTGVCDPNGDSGYDGVSPDHFVVNASGSAAGEPAKPTGALVVTLTFDVSGSAGQFEFDTACFNNSLFTIFMIDNNFPPVDHGPEGTGETSFDKGVISIQAGPCPDVIGSYTSALVSGSELDALSNTHNGTYHHPDGTAAAFYLHSGPGAVNVNTGAWSWTPGAGDDGSYTVEVEVSDVANGEGGCLSNILSFAVDVEAIPVGAVCGSNMNVHWGNLASRTITATTPFTVTYTKIGGPGTLLTTGEWSWTPGCGDISGSPYTVTVEAEDVAGRTEQCSFSVAVGNQPPVSTIPARSFFYAGGYTEDLAAGITDPDGDGLTYSNMTITPTPPENTPSLAGDEITWTPSLNDALNNGGAYHFTVDADDGCALTTVGWDVFVATVNDKVEIGSVAAQAKTKNIILPIRIITTSPMWSISLPLTARSVSGGAFWTGVVDTLPWMMLPEDAISNERKYNQYPNFDLVSPDDFFLWGKAQLGNNHCLNTLDSAAYIKMRFNLNNNPGTFEIDTVFLPPLNHLRFLTCEETSEVFPAFVKGIITIEPCDCSLNGDWDCNGAIYPTDVIWMVNYVYRSSGQGPCNPGNCMQNGDVNCDGVINPVDVIYLVQYVYLPDKPPPCDPCTEM
jgi:hypothetical protein